MDYRVDLQRLWTENTKLLPVVEIPNGSGLWTNLGGLPVASGIFRLGLPLPLHSQSPGQAFGECRKAKWKGQQIHSLIPELCNDPDCDDAASPSLPLAK
jgi:hypothetical protein